ncbi:MAG: WD40 repeat domain-containing protein, partial [Blastocatellia bacterium]
MRLLKKCRQQLHNATPLLGWWLRRRAIKMLARDGSLESIWMLEEAASGDSDEHTQVKIVAALRQLTAKGNIEAQEALCRLVIFHDLLPAQEAALAEQSAPCDASQRALFYFLTGQWEKYESLDFDHSFLRMAYETGGEQLRGRIAHQARQAGRLEWMEVVTGGRQKRRLGEMTNKEWNTALAMLFADRRWEELWRLAQDAPPRWSAYRLQQMNGNGWMPSKEEERGEFDKLMKLAMEWKEPNLSSFTNCQATLEHSFSVTCLAISPDGRLLASKSGDEVRLWNLPDGELIETYNAYGNKRSKIHCLAVNSDVHLLVGEEGDDKIIQVRSLTDGAVIIKLQHILNPITRLAISPDGQLLAGGMENGVIWLWSLPDGKLLKKLKGHRL